MNRRAPMTTPNMILVNTHSGKHASQDVSPTASIPLSTEFITIARRWKCDPGTWRLLMQLQFEGFGVL